MTTFREARAALAAAKIAQHAANDALETTKAQAMERAMRKVASAQQLGAVEATDPRVLANRELVNDSALQEQMKAYREAAAISEHAQAELDTILFEQREADRKALEQFTETFLASIATDPDRQVQAIGRVVTDIVHIGKD